MVDQHRQHSRVQRRAAWCSDETGRRRRRPRRARGAHRPSAAGPFRAGSGRCPRRATGRARAAARHSGSDLSARSLSLCKMSQRDGRVLPSSPSCGLPRSSTAERQQLDRWLAAPPDKTLAMVGSDGRPGRHAGRCRACDVCLPHAPRGDQRPAGPLPQVRHEATRRRACPASHMADHHADHGDHARP